MKRRLSTVAMMIVGSYFVYCGSSSMTGPDGGDGMVDDADAAECCDPSRPAPVVLFDGMVTAGPPVAGLPNYCTWFSDTWDVSGYRTVVIHTKDTQFTVEGRHGVAGFVRAHLVNASTSGYATMQVYDPTMGKELRINMTTNEGGVEPCQALPNALTVIAYPAL